MIKAQKFLLDKNFISSAQAFRTALHQIWFGLYSRENRILGSSGFEHVFLGEIKENKVSGFHNWVFFSKEESNNKVNYKGRIGTVVNLGTVRKRIFLKAQFTPTAQFYTIIIDNIQLELAFDVTDPNV